MSASSTPPREPTPREIAERILQARPERFGPAPTETDAEREAERIELAEVVKRCKLDVPVSMTTQRTPPLGTLSPSPPSPAPPMQRAQSEPVGSKQ